MLVQLQLSVEISAAVTFFGRNEFDIETHTVAVSIRKKTTKVTEKCCMLSINAICKCLLHVLQIFKIT